MEKEVRALLGRFQEGYDRRDLTQLDAFMELFVPDYELEVIGTNAVDPGKGEWCLGQEAVHHLVDGDWEHWGAVECDVKGARIHVRGDVAWLSTTGTVTDTITREERYAGYLDYVKGMLEDEDVSQQAKALEIVRLGNDIVVALPLSETFVWPFRFTAVAVQEEGKWRFHQMHFSFPTTRSPDVRLESEGASG
jgi:hypothetical protein